jgi:hypothetical protein
MKLITMLISAVLIHGTKIVEHKYSTYKSGGIGKTQ